MMAMDWTLVAVERQNAVVVLEQDHALLGDRAGGLKTAFDIDDALLNRMIDDAAEELGTQNSMHVLIQFRLRDLA